MDQLTSNSAVEGPDAPTVELEIELSALRLCGRLKGVPRELEEDVLLSLVAGPTVLGTLRSERQRTEMSEAKNTAARRFAIPDFGLSAFAEMTGLESLKLLSDIAGRGMVGVDLDISSYASNPLGIRHGLGQALRLVDIWLEGSRNLNLRFEGNSHGGKTVDVYQCVAGKLIGVASERPVSGLTAIARIPLINPFEPALLIFKGEDRAIDAIDFVPFPSLARGGLHAAERLIASYGADDVNDTAAVSMELVAALMERRADLSRCVTTIDIDGAVETGLEPALNRDLLSWITRTLGIGLRTNSSAPAFIAEFLSEYPEASGGLGHILNLPADCAPTLGSLLRPLPADAAAGRVAGGYGIADSSGHGHVWSVWEPTLAIDLESLQLPQAPRIAPSLTISNPGSGRPVSLQWPLAIAFRDPPTRIGHTGPLEVAADFEGSLLRAKPAAAPVKLAVLVLAGSASGDVVRLLDSLLRQTGVEIEQLMVCTPLRAEEGPILDALARMVPDRHSIAQVAPTAGRIEQVAAMRGRLMADKVLIADCATVIPDVRTLSTLALMLDAPGVGSAGCLLRQATDKMTPISAGYSLSEIALRAAPQLSFAPIDPSIWRGPSTHTVIANSMALTLVRQEVLATLPAAGSTSIRPEGDDLQLGMHVIEAGHVNLCTTIVSAFSSMPIRPSQAPISIPYRTDAAQLSRMAESATIVQRVA